MTAPVSAHLTVRVAFRNAQGDEQEESDRQLGSSADDGPAEMAQALADENAARKSPGNGDVER